MPVFVGLFALLWRVCFDVDSNVVVFATLLSLCAIASVTLSASTNLNPNPNPNLNHTITKATKAKAKAKRVGLISGAGLLHLFVPLRPLANKRSGQQYGSQRFGLVH